MKKKIFILEDNEFYFDTIKKVLKDESLSFYPESKKDFYQLRQLLNTTSDTVIDSIRKEAEEIISHLLKDNTNEETIFLVTCCLGENSNLAGLTLYQMFTKDYGKKTIIISDATMEKEIEKIKDFCSKETNCLLFRKSEKSLKKDLINYLYP